MWAEEHDIFGDGVNVAARLEALAEPGGVCVSRVVRDQVRDRLDYAFQDLGERQVKALDTELVTAEVARTTIDPDALDYLLRAMGPGARIGTLALSPCSNARTYGTGSGSPSKLSASRLVFNSICNRIAVRIVEVEGLAIPPFDNFGAATPWSLSR
jgi:hypothetical protein